MIRLSHLFIALGSCGVVAVGCGGDDTSSGSASGSLSSGLPKDQVVGTFSDADAKQYCDAVAQYVGSDAAFRAGSCHSVGWSAAFGRTLFGTTTDADLQKACSDAESACLSRMPTSVDAGTSTCQKPAGTCDVTVGELETCTTDSLNAIKEQMSKLPPCATLTAADFKISADAGIVRQQSPASCAVVSQKCPSAIQSTLGGGTGAPPAN